VGGIIKQNARWVLLFVLRILGYVLIFNVVVLPILWVFGVLYMATLVLTYEAVVLLILGALQVLATYVYRENSIPSRWGGSRTGWFDFKRFAELKPKQRQRYKAEGIIITTIGALLLAITAITHFL
jgi:hypothetical protein